MPPPSSKFVKIGTECGIILTSLFLGIFFYYPVCLPLFIFLLLHREIVTSCAKWRHPSWIPTSIMGSAMAVDNLNKTKIHCYSLTFECEHTFDIDIFRERVSQLVFNHPELKSYFVRWMGISFLKPCPTFSQESVLIVDSTRDIQKAEKDLDAFAFQPFQAYQPLWQILIFPNAKANKIIWSIRVHHGLADAFSLIRLIQELHDPDEKDGFQEGVSKLKEKYGQRITCISKLSIILEYFLVIPFTSFYDLLKSFDFNMWTTTEISGAMVQHQRTFDANRIQKVAQKLGCNGNTVFSGALVGALREEMIRRGWSVDSDLTLMYPLPSMKHLKRQLGSFAITAGASIPISAQNMKQRLQAIDEMFSRMRRPAFLLHCDIFVKFSSLLVSLTKAENKPNYWYSGAWTNVSSFGLETGWRMMGKPIKFTKVNFGQQITGIPFVFVVAKLQEEIILYVNSHESIFPGENSLDNFFDLVEQEIVKLSSM